MNMLSGTRRLDRSRDPRAGMTLVEVIVAIAVFALAVLGLLSSIGNSASIDQATRETNIAVLAARAKIEQITAAGYTGVPQYGISPYNAFAVSGLTPQVSGQQQGQVIVQQITTSNSAIYDITVRVQWKGAMGNRVEVLKTMIAEKP
jgi:prepilin-type N-terminal cleavage/methylation domain-containing protein